MSLEKAKARPRVKEKGNNCDAGPAIALVIGQANAEVKTTRASHQLEESIHKDQWAKEASKGTVTAVEVGATLHRTVKLSQLVKGKV